MMVPGGRRAWVAHFSGNNASKSTEIQEAKALLSRANFFVATGRPRGVTAREKGTEEVQEAKSVLSAYEGYL